MRWPRACIRSTGRDHGSAIVEYAGLVLLILLILVSILFGGVPKAISGGISHTICRIMGNCQHSGHRVCPAWGCGSPRHRATQRPRPSASHSDLPATPRPTTSSRVHCAHISVWRDKHGQLHEKKCH